MRRFRSLLASVVPALLALLPAGNVGAVGSFSLLTTDLLTTTTIQSAGSVEIVSGLTFNTVTVGTVALAIEIEEFKSNAQSPHHNVVTITSGVSNTASVSSNGGLTMLQQTAGAANVTMSLTNILVGAGGLTTTVPSVTPTNNPAILLVGTLNQAFTVTNSYWFSQVLNRKLIVDAFIAGTASPTNAIVEDITSVFLSEFSPHHNVLRGTTAANSVTVSGNATLGTVQQTLGFANVSHVINTLLVDTGLFTSTGIVISP